MSDSSGTAGAPQISARWPSIIRTAVTRGAPFDAGSCAAIASLRPRRRRTEARDAIAQLAGTLSQFCDLATLTVGSRDASGQWRARGVADMSDESGLRYRRTQRALQVLTDAGMVHTVQRRERGDMTAAGRWQASRHGTQYRSRNAVRKITMVFWRALGLEVAIARERKKAIKRLQEKQPRAASIAGATVRRIVQRQKRPRVTGAPERTLAEAQQFARLCIEIRRDNPDMPADTVRRRAGEALAVKSAT